VCVCVCVRERERERDRERERERDHATRREIEYFQKIKNVSRIIKESLIIESLIKTLIFC